MILVLDSSPLITLSRIGHLDLLRQLAGTVHVPQAVYDEVVLAGEGRPDRQVVEQAQWIVRHQVRDRHAVERLRNRLGRGEAEAIALAGELHADFVVLDDGTARRIAEAEDHRVLGLLGLLIHAKDRGLVSALRPLLDSLITAGFYLGDDLYRSILQSAGEEP